MPKPKKKPPDPFVQAVVMRLMPLGDVQARPMFGGHGIYVDGLFSALIMRDALYLKADNHNRSVFEAGGATPFRPYPDRPKPSMSYYKVPQDVFDGPDLIPWAEGAVAAARRSFKLKAASSRR
jgi:DNA transformation protein